LNSGDPESSPMETIYLQGGPRDRHQGDAVEESRESEPPIVVGDGRTVHKAKGLAGEQSGQSTHARERNTPAQSVSRTLSALEAKARKEPGHRFRGLARLLDRRMLEGAFGCLKRKASPGIDGVGWAEYAENLDGNLTDLLDRLRSGRYRARCVKRQWIAKAGSNKLRPLGIPVIEDKIVQHAVKQILEAIWEPDFHDESIGYRAGKGARQASLELREALNDGTCRWVVEADIRGFFDHMDHGWLVRMLERRIADRSLIRLIVKWLKAGVLEEGSQVIHPATGTPQGGVISPVLANIYLHYVQDEWIKKVVTRHCKGKVLFRRYADDSVVCFKHESDARAYLRALPKRLGKFSLTIAEEKSSLVKFNRWEPEQSGKFVFLGFDFYWARSLRNPRYVMVKRRTNREKFRNSLKAMKEWIRKVRCRKLSELLVVLRRKLLGYRNYYGVIGNSMMLSRYYYGVVKLLYKWLNRRSQRRSMTWSGFLRRLPGWELPPPRVVERPLNPALRPVVKPA
jgi:RNA-directed DNA polymerase